ncbi:MAG: DMT family transporter [Deltaproteobacteria bacterium]|nr:DMT family transporter [Deltaproteobacteria bacterium]
MGKDNSSGYGGGYGALAALLAAFFFGMSAPASKLLLAEAGPVMLAGLFYLGSFAGLFAFTSVKRLFWGRLPGESALKGRDYFYLAGSIVSGGVAAPLFMLYGLSSTAGSTASLLLNVEGVLTVLIAMLIFREQVGGKVWLAALTMLLASSVLTYSPGSRGLYIEKGGLLVLAAALMWAIDNNLTRELSHRDPVVIAKYKGFSSGVVNLFAAYLLGESLPAHTYLGGALILGALAYGTSLVLFIYALRHLGASRTSTYFGATPFIGMFLSIIILGESFTLRLAAASVLMLASIWLILREYHGHEHTHEAFCHEHRHTHDEHHDHEHEGDFFDPHCHEHEHETLTHSHAHAPDIHHFHRH